MQPPTIMWRSPGEQEKHNPWLTAASQLRPETHSNHPTVMCVLGLQPNLTWWLFHPTDKDLSSHSCPGLRNRRCWSQLLLLSIHPSIHPLTQLDGCTPCACMAEGAHAQLYNQRRKSPVKEQWFGTWWQKGKPKGDSLENQTLGHCTGNALSKHPSVKHGALGERWVCNSNCSSLALALWLSCTLE